MANLASLVVSLTTKTEPFKRGMTTAQKRLVKFRNTIRSGVKSVLKFGAVMSAVALGAAVLLARAGLKNVDVTSKLADRLGIATEQLERFRFAAAQGGVEASALDKSLERMVRSLGEASQGLTTPIRGLETMGLRLEDLQKLSPDEQFLTIADAISQIEDPLEKATASYQIFGRQGQVLINTLNGGRKGIEELGGQADIAGATFDRLSGKIVETANDSIGRLMLFVKGLSNQLAIQLAPFITAVTDRLSAFIEKSGGMAAIVVPAFEKVVKWVGILADVLQTARIWFNLMQTAMVGTFSVLAKGVVVIAEVGNALGVVSDEMVRNAKSIDVLLEKETFDQFAEFKDLLAEDWNHNKLDEFFESIKTGSKEAAEAALKASESTGPIFDPELLEKLALGPAELIKDQIEQVAANTGLARSSGGNFRLDASVGRTQEKQVTLLTSIRDLIAQQPTEQIIVQEVGF